MAEIFMTQEGKDELEVRLRNLKVVGRAEAAERIQEAREFGDLSENAEYDIAKEEQGKLESEIADIEVKLRNAVIIEEKSKGDKVDIGSKIEIINIETNTSFKYTIVGSHESNPMNGRISNESPLGKALLGKKKGEDVIVNAPQKASTYRIVKIL